MDTIEERTQVLSPEEFAKRIEEIAGPLLAGERHGSDPQCSHVFADALICQAMRELGYGGGIDIYDQMVRWYA